MQGRPWDDGMQGRPLVSWPRLIRSSEAWRCTYYLESSPAKFMILTIQSCDESLKHKSDYVSTRLQQWNCSTYLSPHIVDWLRVRECMHAYVYVCVRVTNLTVFDFWVFSYTTRCSALLPNIRPGTNPNRKTPKCCATHSP